MKKIVMGVMVTLVSFGLMSCASQGGPINNQTGGAIIGAAGGGLLGSQFGGGNGRLIMTGLGVLLGAAAGSAVGQQMDELDRMKAQQAFQASMNANQPIKWDNPKSGHHGVYEPTRTGRNVSGEACHEFNQTIVIAGETHTAIGTACKDKSGTWVIQK